MRGLSEKTLQFIKSSNDNVAVTIRDIIKDIKEDNKKVLFLGIRDNFISIYCMGARAVVIDFNIDGKITACKTHKKYIKSFGKDYIVDKEYGKNDDYRDIRIDKIDKKFFDELIDKVEYYTTNEKASESIEKQYQQRIILSNNSSNTNSPWLCYDMEYSMEENGYGRYDILAISTMLNTEKKYSIGLIELKIDYKSLGSDRDDIKELLDEGMIEGYRNYKVITKLNMENVSSKGSIGSGVLGHFSDYIRYINDDEYMKKHNISRYGVTKQEAINILKNYDELALCDGQFKEMIKDLTIDKISDVPEFIFLNYARVKKVESVKTSFRNNVLGGNSLAIVKVWDEKVIDLYRNVDSEIQFKCIFKEGLPEDEANRAIFSDVEISEAKNIFDEEAYK